MYEIVVWFNPNNGTFYYRKYFAYLNKHEVGFKNSYGHEIILVIDLTSNEKVSLKRRIIDNIIYHLKNIR